MRIVKHDSDRVLRIFGRLDITVVDQLRTALRDLINGNARPIVDLAGVEECDTAALQVLCSAQRTAEHSGKPLELAGLSGAVGEFSRAIGLPFPAVAHVESDATERGGPSAV